jgi:DNA topoisomerase-2
MYAGSTHLRVIQDFIAEKTEDSYRIYQSDISSSPAILRIFIEPLSNAIDNVERSRSTKTPCTKIIVSINFFKNTSSLILNLKLIKCKE